LPRRASSFTCTTAFKRSCPCHPAGNQTVSTPVNRLKGVSTYYPPHEFTGQVNRHRMRGHFWTTSKRPLLRPSVGSASLTVMAEYIENQKGPGYTFGVSPLCGRDSSPR